MFAQLSKAVCLAVGMSFGLGAVSAATGAENSQASGDEMTMLQSKLDKVEQRATRVADINAVKRLQRAYGYYIDKGLWDQAADLFAENGTIEVGLDGVYVGKKRVRAYLRAMGNGKEGLAEGRLNEHIQLMPFITVAPDGKTAKGRWRGLLLLGQLGDHAWWGEGPYENDYVKEDGVWKIKALHWYQSMVVDYVGGWPKNKDANQGIWVSDKLPPDRPPTLAYKTWPATFLPPFHFPNPVTGKVHDKPEMATEASGASSDPAPLSEAEIAKRAAVLAHEVQHLEDQHAVENLQRIYGFYTDKDMWDDAADLFANNGTIEVGGHGVYVGKARVLAFLKTLGKEYPQEGKLFDQMQLQGIVDIAPDGKTAKGRWHMFAQEAEYGKYARWGLGVYENDYVKQDGVWKIAKLHLYTTMYTPYEDGWGKTAIPNGGPLADLPPDKGPSVAYKAYPAVFVPPFHYDNPVTSKPAADMAKYADKAIEKESGDELDRTLAQLDQRTERLNDAADIENLHAAYGYYLARNQWDDLAGIFSYQGAIEIAMRGVYVGPASVRRNLNLYGKEDIQYGLLHNHMQYQPVINVAPDGKTARMRSRAFSIMGNYNQFGMWMGGVYENVFIKEKGKWTILKDQVINTYFVPYDQGWKDSPLRPPPGITKSNPPDEPPTVDFQMYPKPYLPRYHYDNPVTGKPAVWPGHE